MNKIRLLPTLLLLVTAPGFAQIRISEISATGTDAFLDFEDEASDWIEIENLGGAAAPLVGWSLSDDPENPGKWSFPDVTLFPGAPLTIFASGKDGAFGSPVELHANFRLSRSGESVVLTPPAGSEHSQSRIDFAEQRRGYTYGVLPNRTGFYYLDTPTPGAVNQSTTVLRGIVSDVAFLTKGGFHDSPTMVVIQPSDPLSKVYYTLDHTTPNPETSHLYDGPIQATETLHIRAAAFRNGYIPSNAASQSFWIGAPDWMSQLPILSLTLDPEDLSGESGIRGFDSGGNPNAVKVGREWERPVSVRFRDRSDPDNSFDIDAGIRMHGNNSTRTGSKPSFRLYFREEYGRELLEFPLVPESEVQTFSGLVLRGGHQDPVNPFIQDELARRLYADMGQASSLGTFVHLIVNGVHYGYYNPVERYDGGFFSARFGVESDWNIFRNGSLGEGSAVPFQELYQLVQTQSVEDPNVYREVTQRLDVVNFIDYLLLNLYGSTWDWPGNNVVISHEAAPGGKIRHHVWDAEGTFGLRSDVTADTLEVELLDETTNESRLFVALSRNPNFRRLFASRVRKHFYEDGSLVESHVMDRFLWLRGQVLPAIPNFVPTASFGWIPLRRHYLFAHLQLHGMLEEVDHPTGGLPPTGTTPPPRNVVEALSADLDNDGRVDARDLTPLLSRFREERRPSAFGRPVGRQERWQTWSLPVGKGVRDLAFADLDGDGLDEILAVNANYGVLMVLPNLGSGRFAPPEFLDTGLGASAIAVGDFNGDGLLDAATGNDGMTRQSLSVFLNQGDGLLEKAGEVEIATLEENPYIHIRQIHAADLDQDSNLDLFVSFYSAYVNQENRSTMLFGDGQGGFAERTSAPMGRTRLLGSTLSALADFRGNGDLSAVVLDGNRSALLWERIGGRTFAEPLPIPQPSNTEPLAVASADLDGDGLPDLAFSDGPAGSIRILFNQGGGIFSAEDSVRIPAMRPTSMITGDFDGDGSVDLLAAHLNPTLSPRSTVQTFWNRGVREFEPGPPLELGGDAVFPGWLAVGNAGGTSLIDFAVADEFNGRITLFLNISEEAPEGPDLNLDGRIDFSDLGIFTRSWKTATSPSGPRR